MARRKTLNGVAANILSAFISRNNDLGGYWGIGKLCRLSRESKTDAVRLDLVSQRITPCAEAFSPLVKQFSTLFYAMLTALGLQKSCVVSAVLSIDFYPEAANGGYRYLAVCRCEISDDLGKNYKRERTLLCRPHNPRLEMRSGRFDKR